MEPEVLHLLVVYNNMAEVDYYIDHVREVGDGGAMAFSVCDNSAVGTPSRHADADWCSMIERPDNPGYLEGALEAMRHYQRTKGDLPQWIVLSNTDLRHERGPPVTAVLRDHDPLTPLILAPRITEGSARVEKNPHGTVRRSVRRLHRNHLATCVTPLAMLYLGASAVRLFVSKHRWRRTAPGSRAAGGTSMYSPYGAMVIFSRAFMQMVTFPRNVPLLSEEYVIAEEALAIGALVVFEPRINIHHISHTTTGRKFAIRRARMLSVAFRYIDHDARSRGRVG